MKLYTHKEMLNRVLGKPGTPSRDDYEQSIHNFFKRRKIHKAL